jgi:hypothetical protein
MRGLETTEEAAWMIRSSDGVEPRSRMVRGRLAAVVAIVLATVAGVWLVVWPCLYTGVTSSPRGDDVHTCSSLIAENGAWVLALLAVPVVVTVLGFFAVVGRFRAVTWALALLLFALCILAAFSIGLFYLPSAIALIVAAARHDRTQPRTSGRRSATAGDQ